MLKTDFVWPSEPIIIVDVEGNGHTPPDLVEVGIASFPPMENRELLSWFVGADGKLTHPAD
ncbi:hypothetical protein HBR94_28300 [Pseudomonas sp. WS 5412]|uniref:hypothetical protein n=1 Tax=Pseudomonas sp. WS 5412 TaxID=2717487 RepID=UPI001475B167|nr:hypothetical protein [Pseudomonas sp. WS 5412]NMY35400.1 hypothetical protein [Pseudomonas sp. WS 5412]